MDAKNILTNAGMNVVTACDGQESLDKLELQKFDCALMDVQMPTMDGYTATRAIRQSEVHKNIPVIALSANVMERDIELGREAGMDADIGKLINIDRLLELLVKYV